MQPETLKDEILTLLREHVATIITDTCELEDTHEDATAEEILRAIQRHYPQVVFDPPLSPG